MVKLQIVGQMKLGFENGKVIIDPPVTKLRLIPIRKMLIKYQD
ncbi:MAG: hypothetical protein OEW70_06880 [candidate division WOR-3 bacterium]|nr:hypothetical protein [candidate division WOR-3 bacterium]